MDIVDKLEDYMAKHYSPNPQDNDLTLEDMESWIIRFKHLRSLMKGKDNLLVLDQYTKDFKTYIRHFDADRRGKDQVNSFFDCTSLTKFFI